MTFTNDPPAIESLELIPDYKEVISQEAGGVSPNDLDARYDGFFPAVLG
jgi:hypothetical protein